MLRSEDSTLPFATIVLEDFPASDLKSANVKLHHHAAGPLRARWRERAFDAARRAYGTPEAGEAWHRAIRVEVEVRFPDRRRHDVANLYSYVFKPIVDGLVDAGVVIDDDDRHLIGPDPRRDIDRGPLRVLVKVYDL